MTNKGGRGKKASYKTTHARIPENIKLIVDSLSNSYKEYVAESGCLDFDEKNFLPMSPAIYFVISNDDVLYVGQSKKLSNRWKSHHLLKSIKGLNQTEPVQIAWLTCTDTNLLTVLERIFIDSLQPELNLEHLCLQALTPFPEKWKSGKTKTIRVPVAIVDEVLLAARLIDEGKALSADTSKQDLSQAIAILSDALKLKANAGGAIKQEIRKALEMLTSEES